MPGQRLCYDEVLECIAEAAEDAGRRVRVIPCEGGQHAFQRKLEIDGDARVLHPITHVRGLGTSPRPRFQIHLTRRFLGMGPRQMFYLLPPSGEPFLLDIPSEDLRGELFRDPNRSDYQAYASLDGIAYNGFDFWKPEYVLDWTVRRLA